jgi:histone deacetylase 1/2
LSNFFAYARTQFGAAIKAVQCDNGREFDHSSARTFLLTHGALLRMSCPYTSQQNGRAERILRTINNIIRSLLFQASLPPVYWADTLHTATYLLNRHPTKTLAGRTPHFALYGTHPSYDHLRVFGCACYPNLSSTATNKLSPRSTLCVFLGYSTDHKGYRCLDLQSNRIIVSRHVVFDESSFPFAAMSTTPSDPGVLDFLSDDDTVTLPIGPSAAPVGPLDVDAAPSSPHSGVAAPVDAPSQAVASSAAGGATTGDAAPGAAAHSAAATSAGAPVGSDPGTAAPAASSPPTVAASSPSTAAPAPQVAASGTWRTSSTAPVTIPPVTNDHSMRTRGKSGIAQPMDRLNLNAAVLSPLPVSLRSALADPNWRAAMQLEFEALKANDTWSLVPRPPGVNIVTDKWVFRHKFLSDGPLDRYKDRWVLRGFTQRPASTMMRLSAQLSSLPQFVWFSAWLLLGLGLCINSMSKMPFSMVI